MGGTGSRRGGPAAPLVLVWIDSRSATIVRGEPAGPVLERVESTVPPHHRSTGRVRIDPAVRHGGGGPAGDRIERDRLEHRREFLAAVAGRIAAGADVVVVGPGTVREHLAALLDREPRRIAAGAAVVGVSAGRRTDRQLVARYLELVGEPPARAVHGSR